MGGIRDHEEEIYDLIRSEPSVRWGVNNIARKLRMQLNKVVEAYQNLTKIGLLTRHEGDKDWPYPFYTPNQDLVENYIEFREGSIKFYEEQALKRLKSLKRKKIFTRIKKEKTEQGGTILTATRNKKAEEDYKSFKANLNLLITVTSTLPFAQVLGTIPKKPKYTRMIIKNQQKSLTVAKKLINQLRKDHKSQVEAIDDDLRWSIPVLAELNRMPNYFESKKKS